MVLFCIYFSSALSSSSTSSAPCSSVYRSGSVICSLTVPSHHVLVPFHHGLPQNEVSSVCVLLPLKNYCGPSSETMQSPE